MTVFGAVTEMYKWGLFAQNISHNSLTISTKCYQSVSVLLPSLSAKQIVFFCAVLYCHLWSVWLYHNSPYCIINGTIFRKENTQPRMRILMLSTSLSEILLILKIIQRDIIIKVQKTSCKVSVILVKF